MRIAEISNAFEREVPALCDALGGMMRFASDEAL